MAISGKPRQAREWRGRAVVAGLALVVFVLVAAFGLGWSLTAPLLAQVDAQVQDGLVRRRNQFFPQPRADAVSLIGIDDQTIREIGRYGQGIWQTREPYIEHLVYYLRYQPKVIAYDILFKEDEGRAQADPLADQEATLARIAEAVRRKAAGEDIRDNHLLKAIGTLTVRQGNDNLGTAFTELRQSEGAPAIIFGYTFAEGSAADATYTAEEILGPDPAEASEDRGTLMPYLRDVRLPLECVRNLPADYPFFTRRAQLPTERLLNAGQLGYINAPRDADGVTRRYPLVWGFQYAYADPASGQPVQRRFFLPSLALLGCLSYWGIDLYELNQSGVYTNRNGQLYVELVLGRHLIVRPPGRPPVYAPIDDRGNLLLDYVGRLTDYHNLPFAGIGGDRAVVEPRLRDKLVFVGSTETGGTDSGPTPVDPYTALVLVHLTAASNLLTGTFLRPVGLAGALGVLLVLCLVTIPAAVFLRPKSFLFLISGLGFAYLLLVFAALARHWYVLPITAPLAQLFITTLTVTLYRYFTEEKEKKKIRVMFSTMVSREVLAYMEEHPESFSLAGERREATMFFSDVAGFTTISESLPPEKLVELLNQYLSPMTEIIQAHNGYVDKYAGDGIMAEWGVPYPNPDHARLACFAALAQQAKIAELRPQFRRDFNVEVSVRMGLNSGPVSAGNMGAQGRFSYTVMGDAVNQAARFEPANKDYGTLIMLGQTTYDLAKDEIEARLLDKIVVKGKTEPIRIYELVARKGQAPGLMLEVMHLYQRGLELHWERQWDEALACFHKALELAPQDGPSKTMVARIAHYRHEPPPPTWRGEYVRKAKD